jgi:hypothetical protein
MGALFDVIVQHLIKSTTQKRKQKILVFLARANTISNDSIELKKQTFLTIESGS